VGSITKKAQILNLSNWGRLKKLSDISILLKETPESYYWMGFLMADGHFSDKRISLTISEQDLPHLMKFKKYVNSKNAITKLKKENCYRIKMTSVKDVKELKSKFKISSKKTYKPCDFKHIKNKKLLFSLIVGLIDGDGSISKNKNWEAYQLSFTMHSSWVDSLNYIKTFLYTYFNEEDKTMPARTKVVSTYMPQDKNKIKKDYDVSYMYICKKTLLRRIKTKAEELKIPFMKRKLGQLF